MSAQLQPKKLYIVVSQTGSIVARLIKVFTHQQYNHASLSLTSDLQWMFSFGRVHPYNPFWGGFVREAPDKGAMKRFSDAQVAVIEVEVDAEKFESVRQTISDMLAEQKKYRYNYLGLFKAAVKVKHRSRPYRYYCSEFVGDVLLKNRIIDSSELPDIVHPMNFLDLPYNVVYRGRLCDYSAVAN